uniref:Transposase n=1 Tax=Ascaris lumbricoides TaxID=6252 RepID=A0A0M3HUP1_ASCLU
MNNNTYNFALLREKKKSAQKQTDIYRPIKIINARNITHPMSYHIEMKRG